VRCLTARNGALLGFVGTGAVVAAGAVVSPDAQSPERRMALGVPARVRDGYEVPADMTDHPVQSYRQRGKRFRAELRRLEV
jgi:carbonic anhydrase/acetyltransferase-like protein (isoleucine patch superfamily)